LGNEDPKMAAIGATIKHVSMTATRSVTTAEDCMKNQGR
jgi:hypothetical protein